MRHIILIFATLALSIQLNALPIDVDSTNVSQGQNQDLSVRIDSLSNKINEQQSAMQSLLNELSISVGAASSNINSLSEEILCVRTSVDSLGNEHCELRNKQGTDYDNLSTQIAESNSMVLSNLKRRTNWGIVVVMSILLILIIALWCQSKKLKMDTSSIEEVRKAQAALRDEQTRLQEESVKIDNKLVELLEKQLSVVVANQHETEIDHSLTLKVADEIVRMEMNLYKMDSSIRGYKQLSKAIQRIKDNFLANGYEIVDMLGKPYNGGMRLVANFVPDESLPFGQQIITGIIKPQVNYNGKMIQAAQITVSQNI